MNPFSDEYVKREVNFFGLSSYNNGSIMIKSHELIGRYDDFFNVRYRTGEFVVPVFYIDGKLWMSLAPMELQSHYLPIMDASGYVGVAGLGMGYYALRIMASKTVEKIDIYEINKRVVDYFRDCFSDREGFEKVNFIIGDARELIRGKTYDFLYVDIYPELCCNRCIDDIFLFRKNNEIDTIHVWGQEKVIKTAFENRMLSFNELAYGEKFLLKMWVDSEGYQLRDNYLDDKYCQEVLGAMERL